ncbi:hypothetical protein [Alkalicoccus daliensis]|uniref:DUF2867 domain-containing protein n=1 Tax=Alkalicoccus daliensis TaxID=745820 RepID=A0A1H0ADY8_9BACI|nr:hypothetical protein [Alkalicoccus daliensis]SDN31818.1 hypothetical protein SAMN04488053_101451 [Alkalicoccus daliensis]
MNRRAMIYIDDNIPEIKENTDFYRMHASLQPGCLRITPAAIKKVCEMYDTVILLLPLSTNDAFQQGKPEVQQAFILELFRHWAAIHRTTLILEENKQLTIDKKAGRHVTSVQAWHEKSVSPAEDIARSYFRFLPRWTKKVIRVSYNNDKVKLILLRVPLIELAKDTSARMPAAVSSWIVSGGLLVKKSNHSKGRLWFVRSSVKPGLTYAAITHFKPAVPWLLYVYSQALIHKLVMNHFAAWRFQLTRRKKNRK